MSDFNCISRWEILKRSIEVMLHCSPDGISPLSSPPPPLSSPLLSPNGSNVAVHKSHSPHCGPFPPIQPLQLICSCMASSISLAIRNFLYYLNPFPTTPYNLNPILTTPHNINPSLLHSTGFHTWFRSLASHYTTQQPSLLPNENCIPINDEEGRGKWREGGQMKVDYDVVVGITASMPM